jgi:hypothetical protein
MGRYRDAAIPSGVENRHRTRALTEVVRALFVEDP